MPVERGLRQPTDPLEIIYTSGTTGDPKGVVCSQARYAMATMFGSCLAPPGRRPYTGLSLTHGNAQMMTLGPALHMKLRAVFSRKFTKSRLWGTVRAHGCTVLNLLGGMATAIYSEPVRADDGRIYARLSSIWTVISISSRLCIVVFTAKQPTLKEAQ